MYWTHWRKKKVLCPLFSFSLQLIHSNEIKSNSIWFSSLNTMVIVVLQYLCDSFHVFEDLKTICSAYVGFMALVKLLQLCGPFLCFAAIAFYCLFNLNISIPFLQSFTYYQCFSQKLLQLWSILMFMQQLLYWSLLSTGSETMLLFCSC